MKKITMMAIACLLAAAGISQHTHPVQFSCQSTRLNDSTASLTIYAHLQKGYTLFTTIKKDSTAPYYSTVAISSASGKPTVLQLQEEKGITTCFTDPETRQRYKLLGDSVTLDFQLQLYKEDSTLKCNINYLLLHDSETISNDTSFTLTVSKVPPRIKHDISHSSLLYIFMFCFATGLLAVITPCVFPLVPVTVSFFLKRAESRASGISSALWYSLSIIAIYTLPTLLLTRLFGDAVLYKISTSAISNMLFFFIFILFAISFFGGFELALPNKWANKADSAAGKGGWTGIFFMALTLVIVSFSCTGPIVGTLLSQTSKQGIGIAPIVGMLAFSIGLALPFTLFALFPALLTQLPKSGGWLNSVKITFGFIELALGLKFLSNVDLIYGWHLLDREIFLAIWIALTLLMGLYLLGKLQFAHDSHLKHIPIPRLLIAITTFTFALYLIPGLWGAPLKAMSGILPPVSTQDFNLDESQYMVATGNTLPLSKQVKLGDKLHLPNGLSGYFDLDEGIAAAKTLNKPIMLDFTGHSCANCRKMEQTVWREPEVLKRMKEDFIIISLYVDEPTELPIEEQYTTKDGKRITTVGDRNLDYEITHFGVNAQPLYMFISSHGSPLSTIKYGYDPNVQKFISHLEEMKHAGSLPQ